MRKRLVYTIVFIACFCFSAGIVSAEKDDSDSSQHIDKLIALDLEDLPNVSLLNFDSDIISASKKKERYAEVSSAIYLLTNEDIRRSGATHIAEVLRLVPGIQVARIDANRWAITARGFNSSFANLLLVLVDGVSIFSTDFNGVFWDQHELMLEDIEKIEVIRGPGAAVWGSNAVNGVVNIITKNSSDTQGSLLSAGGGSQERFFSSLRHGGKVGENASYRVFGKFVERDDNKFRDGGDSEDGYEHSHGGFRVDAKPSKEDSLTLKGTGFYLDKNLEVAVPSLSPPFVDRDSFSGGKTVWGASTLGRWERELPSSTLSAQLDYSYEHQAGHVFPTDRHSAHIELRHQFSPLNNHNLLYGIEYRYSRSKIEPNFADAFIPKTRSANLFTFFLSDDVTLVQDKLRLIAGVKLERNSYTDYEVGPNVRLLWTPTPKQSVWASITRAVASPSRVSEDVITPIVAFPEPNSGLTGVVTLNGSSLSKAQNLTAYEIGYRAKLSETFSIDLAAFINDYDDILSSEPGEPFVDFPFGPSAPPALFLPNFFENNLNAQSVGVEVVAAWQFFEFWRLSGGYSFLDLDLSIGNSLDAANVTFFEGASPKNQFFLRSLLDVTQGVEFDSILRYVDHLTTGNIPSYLELDLRFAWTITDGVELSVVGQNLLESSHEEFVGVILPPPATEIKRGVYGKITWEL